MNQIEIIPNKLKFVKALWVHERYELIKNGRDVTNLDKKGFEEWKERKSIVSKEDYEEIFKTLNYSEEIFSEAIRESSSHDRIYLDYLNSCDWYNLFIESLQLPTLRESENMSAESLDQYIIVGNFLEYATDKIFSTKDKYPQIGKSAIRSALQGLLEILTGLSHKATVFEINLARISNELQADTSTERYFEYFEKMRSMDNLVEFYEKYPVLVRLLSTCTKDFIYNMNIFSERFTKDYTEVINKFHIVKDSVLVDMKMELGDTHERGNSVIKLTFSDNTVILYKPKNLEVAQSFSEFCKWINKKERKQHIKVYDILSYDNYTYEEFVAQKSCRNLNEVHQYFENFGKLSAILYFLRGNDFHMENIIAAGKYPVVVDLETLLQRPNAATEESNFFLSQIRKNMKNSIVRTSLFPSNGPSVNLDMSAFSGDVQDVPFEVEIIKDIKMDTIRYEYTTGKLPKSNNQPSLKGEKVNGYEYIDDINRGFNELFDFLIDNKEQVKDQIGVFRNKKIRMLVRNTVNYARMIQMALHPSALRDALEREKIFENMWHYGISEKKIHKSEVRDLLENDIPIFFSNTSSLDVYDSRGYKIENYYEKTAYEIILNDIDKLDDKVKNKQASIIRLVTKNYSPQINSSENIIEVSSLINSEMKSNGSFIKQAENIGYTMMGHANFSDDGEFVLIDCINSVGEDTWDIGCSSLDFYNGLTGLELFYHYLYEETKKEEFLAFENVLHNTEYEASKSVVDHSVITGEQSWLTKEVLCFSNADSSLNRILTGFQEILDNIDKLETFDWIGGTSSVVQLAILMYEKTDLEIFVKIAEKLMLHIENQLSNIKLRGGFSHGVSSLAYLNGKMFQLTKNKKFSVKCNELIEYDNSLLNPDMTNWLDNRFEDYLCNCHWCHGGLGIGLSRLMLYYDCGIEEDIIRRDIEIANKSVYDSYITKDDTLCHGNSGKIDFYLEQYLLTGNEDYYNYAKSIGNYILNKKQLEYGQLPEIPSISLFTGLAGIGYEMLRLENPQNVPSVLTLH